MHLIETKRPKGVVRSEQLRDHARRRRLGVEVLVIDTAGKVDTYLSYMKELCGL